jgi:hypothetical protein
MQARLFQGCTRCEEGVQYFDLSGTAFIDMLSVLASLSNVTSTVILICRLNSVH